MSPPPLLRFASPFSAGARALVAASLAVALGGCSGSPTDAPDGDLELSDETAIDGSEAQPLGEAAFAACPAGSGVGPLGGSRPATLKVPWGYRPSRRYPLVIELHGRGGKGTDAESYLQMSALADRNQMFVIAPDGTLDAPPAPTAPASFWNATEGCCNLYNSPVDDVAYLRSLICHTAANYAIDPNKVFIIGVSNGGFMAHRMACDASDLVTAIISLAGVTWHDATRCKPTHPVSVLQIHGTKDNVVAFDGMDALAPGPTPSVPVTYETWAALNQCSGDNVVGDSIDFDQNVAGRETTPVWKALGGTCKVATQLWIVRDGGHGFRMSTRTKQFFIDWFKAAPPNH